MGCTDMKSLTSLLTFIGIPFAAASVITILLRESRPVTLRDLSERTGYAKSHLSTHLKHLVNAGLVEVHREKGRIKYSVRKKAIIQLLHQHLHRLHTYIQQVSNEVNDHDLRRELDEIAHRLSQLIVRGEKR